MALIRLDDTKLAREIGKKGTCRFIWAACPNCGKERWVNMRPTRPSVSPLVRLCLPCSSKRNWQFGSLKRWKVAKENNPMWKGGRIKDGNGYIAVRVFSDDFFYPMARSKGSHNGGYIQEHRLVMAKHIGRCLHQWEIVHHKNGIKDDNRLENLGLQNRLDHIQAHSKGYRDGYLKGLLDGHTKAIKELQNRVTILEAENVLLKSQLAKDGVI